MMDAALELEIGAVTDPGRKRQDEPNQDSILVIPPDADNGRPPLLIIADGMGGYQGGAVASQIVVETTARHYRESNQHHNVGTVLAEGIHLSREALSARAAQDAGLEHMGSTVVMVVPMEERVFCANVGDSRGYILNAREIRQISQDQSMVGEQVRAGLLTALQALRHPKRNRLTQSISAKRKDVQPYLAQAAWARDDVLLLCTDGLWGVISETIVRAVAWELPPQTAAEKLVALSKASGAPDNVSVIIARRKGWKVEPQRPGDDITDPGL